MTWILTIVSWLKRLQWVWFAISMMRKWGPKQWAILKGIHDDLEARKLEAAESPKPEEIAREFNKEAEQKLAELSRKKEVPTRPTLNAMREDVWKYRNPGKEPKPIEDARYRAMPRRAGKTARR